MATVTAIVAIAAIVAVVAKYRGTGCPGGFSLTEELGILWLIGDVGQNKTETGDFETEGTVRDILELRAVG